MTYVFRHGDCHHVPPTGHHTGALQGTTGHTGPRSRTRLVKNAVDWRGWRGWFSWNWGGKEGSRLEGLIKNGLVGTGVVRASLVGTRLLETVMLESLRDIYYLTQ